MVLLDLQAMAPARSEEEGFHLGRSDDSGLSILACEGD
ncbi:SapB/AmfS family lanthipeptide [Streptomyces roseoverticillatus]|uniref:SapB/AmfS family lanthipeptide n=1 Tax=Streptomyces roseoverticillatus TaxID=66429 RepID=A0ABV3IVW3_9ACTN